MTGTPRQWRQDREDLSLEELPEQFSLFALERLIREHADARFEQARLQLVSPAPRRLLDLRFQALPDGSELLRRRHSVGRVANGAHG